MDFIAMRPSEWRKLAEQPADPELDAALVSSIETFLKAVSDLGSDEIYVTAIELSNAGVWDRLAPRRVAKAISQAGDSTASAFLDGIPSTPRRLIEVELGRVKTRKPRPEPQMGIERAVAAYAARGAADSLLAEKNRLRSFGYKIVRISPGGILDVKKIAAKRNPRGRFAAPRLKVNRFRSDKSVDPAQEKHELEKMGFLVVGELGGGGFQVVRGTSTVKAVTIRERGRSR